MQQTVLLVDDDSLIRKAVAITLAPADLTIIHARDGHEALDMVHRYRPNLVLLDEMMPGMGGLEVCRLLKANPLTSRIKVIMLTRKSSADDRSDVLAAGADGHFPKPFSPVALLTAVTQTLGIAFPVGCPSPSSTPYDGKAASAALAAPPVGEMRPAPDS